MTHNLDVIGSGSNEQAYVCGKEGVGVMNLQAGSQPSMKLITTRTSIGAGEVKVFPGSTSPFITTVEPMHGNQVAVYSDNGEKRTVLDTSLSEGHALGVFNVMGSAHPEIIAGWRRPNSSGKVGVKLFTKKSETNDDWEQHWIDDNGMACEDLQLADLNGDQKPDIIAAGRATRNLKIYWNQVSVK